MKSHVNLRHVPWIFHYFMGQEPPTRHLVSLSRLWLRWQGLLDPRRSWEVPGQRAGSHRPWRKVGATEAIGSTQKLTIFMVGNMNIYILRSRSPLHGWSDILSVWFAGMTGWFLTFVGDSNFMLSSARASSQIDAFVRSGQITFQQLRDFLVAPVSSRPSSCLSQSSLRSNRSNRSNRWDVSEKSPWNWVTKSSVGISLEFHHAWIPHWDEPSNLSKRS